MSSHFRHSSFNLHNDWKDSESKKHSEQSQHHPLYPPNPGTIPPKEHFFEGRFSFSFGTYYLFFFKKNYANGGLAITITDNDGHPFAKLSLWAECSPSLPPNCFFVKDYSENLQIFQALQSLPPENSPFIDLSNSEEIKSLNLICPFPVWAIKKGY